MTSAAPRTNPGVHFPPPLVYLAGLLAGYGVDRYLYRMPLPNARHLSVHVAGVVIALLGVALVAWGMRTFRAARTAIIPFHAASRLVDAGPYRFTRNPMYTGMAIAYLGVATMLGSLWPFIVLPIVLIIIASVVIAREEAYLGDAFGADYAVYCSRVRRWL
jgi:protein-S-isoprenylcysteine O-methyltransferase Ste14